MIASQLRISAECSSPDQSAVGRTPRASTDSFNAEGPGHELLRWLAEEADTAGTLDDLRGVWQALLEGRLHVVDTFYSPTRWFLVLRRGALRTLPEGVQSVLEHSLLDDSQKRAALECGIASSTFSMIVGQAFKSRGIEASPGKAPPIVALAALVDTAELRFTCRRSSLQLGGDELRVYTVTRPEGALAPQLSAAEQAVLLRVIEGRSYAQIAIERRTACRTVANQVAHAFQRLGVSGRGQLIGLLLRLATNAAASLAAAEPDAGQARAGW